MSMDEIRDRVVELLHIQEGYCGHCGKSECAGKVSDSRLPNNLKTRTVLDCLQQAFDEAKKSFAVNHTTNQKEEETCLN